MVRQVCSIVRASALQVVPPFCEGLLDHIEVWRVGGQEELGFGGADRGANGAALMAAEGCPNDNVVRREDGRENLLDISAEACAIDRSVDDIKAVRPPQQRRRNGGPPFTEGRFGDEALNLAQRPWARRQSFWPRSHR